MSISPLPITATSIVSALGAGIDQLYASFQSDSSGLSACELEGVDFQTWIGQVPGLEDMKVRTDLLQWDCRNNRLAQLALEQDGFSARVDEVISRYGIHRVGLFLGTSTSGIQEAERAYADRDLLTDDLPTDFSYSTTQNIASVSGFCRQYFGLKGPVLTLSTACSSSAKVFATAWRYIQAGYCDAAVVGGVDSLCLTTLYGFNSLGLLSDNACQPWDANRKGINIGEAAGFMLLDPASAEQSVGSLLGYGESSDAYHMSTPHPQGLGAAMAMKQALKSSGLDAEEIDYVNLHGTGTTLNDLSEAQAMQRIFKTPVFASSTKGWTGHTLGASGIVEAIVSLMCLEHDLLPANRNLNVMDEALSVPVLSANRKQRIDYVMSNSFGFGGSNCSLIFGRTS